VDGVADVVKQIAASGPLGLLCALLVYAIYKLFVRYEAIQAARIEDAKKSQEDSRRAMSLLGEIEPLLRELTQQIRDDRRIK
jgi:hypothetical protein